jgi:hypothetical protein
VVRLEVLVVRLKVRMDLMLEVLLGGRWRLALVKPW